MKTSRILTTVLYEPWMILPGAAEAFLPMVANWLMGNNVHFEEKPRLGLQMVSAGKISPGYPEDIHEMPDNTVAIVSLKGELTKYDGVCNYGAMSIANLLKQIAISKNITNVVLDIDGPGGSVNAIAPIIEAMRFLEAAKKQTVIHADTCGSAHYYIAAHSKHIFMDNNISSQAGSIGTLIQFADYKEYFEAKGIKLHTIYAPESTHKNRDFEDAIKGEYEGMKKNVLSPLARNFQETVRRERAGKLNENADGILNGAMFWAEDAVKYGLADKIGTLGDSIQRAIDLVEINKFMR